MSQMLSSYQRPSEELSGKETEAQVGKVTCGDTDPERSATGMKLESCLSPDAFSHFLRLPLIQRLKSSLQSLGDPKTASRALLGTK